MPIVQEGAINTTALWVPNPYVQIVAPKNYLINGVPTNIVGVVGTASWGPVNTATIIGSAADYVAQFGTVVNRKYDLGTSIAIMVGQGASNFRVVRVTDGTDTKASAALSTDITFTSKYSGSLGNTTKVTLGTGSAVGTWSAVVSISGNVPEKFDNLTGAGNAFWAGLAAAINSGQTGARGPSQIITAVAGVGTSTPTAGTTTLSGGTDGAAVDTADMIGLDTDPRTGMYALRKQQCSIGLLVDCDDSTAWTTQVSFGLSESIDMIMTGAASQSIADMVAAKASAGIDSYAAKLMHGDWIYWRDEQNGVIRLVSPAPFVAGLMANQAPNQSPLNKQLYGVVGSEKSGTPGGTTVHTYSDAELQALFVAGLDVITNPAPGGSYWTVRGGINTSSNSSIRGDNYTRMTNYLATTLEAAMGKFIGRNLTYELLPEVRASHLSFLGNLLQQGILSRQLDGSLPYSVKCDKDNNIADRIGLGYLQVDVQVRYTPIVFFLIVNLEGGQTVKITITTSQG